MVSSSESNSDIKLQESADIAEFKASADLMDQVSIFISICTGGIALFGIFGASVTYYNLQKNKELEESLKNVETALETQKELESWRWVQEGRYYKSLKKYKYAQSCFEHAEQKSGDLIVHCIAVFEQYTLQFDVSSIDLIAEDDLNKIIEQMSSLINDLEKQPKKLNQQFLLQEAYFQQGCLYGSYAKKIHNIETGEKFGNAVNSSIQALKKAIKLDSNNADFKRNISISYILSGNEEKAIQSLRQAQNCVEYDKLDKDLLSPERLSALFRPYKKFISLDLQNKLGEEFGVIG